MKNYQDSDYAANIYSPNIVYRFADGNVEITQEDYLRDNTDKTEQDFTALKALSDEIYHEQIIHTNRTSRLDVSMSGLDETELIATVPFDVTFIQKGDERNALIATKKLLESGDLTKVQRRRFILHFFKGVSIRRIAASEGVHKRAVWDSLQSALKKLKKYFSE